MKMRMRYCEECGAVILTSCYTKCRPCMEKLGEVMKEEEE